MLGLAECDGPIPGALGFHLKDKAVSAVTPSNFRWELKEKNKAT